jgi:hypothetical protein
MGAQSHHSGASIDRVHCPTPAPKHIDAPEQVILWGAIFEPKLIEQTWLIANLPTHHRRLCDRCSWNQRNHCSAAFSSLFRQHRPQADMVCVTCDTASKLDACLTSRRSPLCFRLQQPRQLAAVTSIGLPGCTENLIRVDDVMESPKLAE